MGVVIHSPGCWKPSNSTLQKHTANAEDPERGELVVFRNLEKRCMFYEGRIIATAGQTVEWRGNGDDLSSVTPTVPVATLNIPGPAANDQFGSSVAISGSTIAIGTPFDDTVMTDKGFAYIFGPDTTPPVLTLPANITAEATSAAGATVTYTASASDAGSGVATSSFLPASGSTFPIGMTTVNASATDIAGNTASGSFTVTVADTTAPTIGGTFSPLNIVAGTPLPDFTAQATAFDAAGHTADVLFNVTVTPADPVSTLLASKGAAVPGAGVDTRIQAGAVWTMFGVPSVNDAGQVAFLGSWKAPAVTGASPLPAQSGTGIFVDGALVVKKGAAAPGITNAVISAMKEPLLGASGGIRATGSRS